MDLDLSILTVAEIAAELKVKTDTVRRLFAAEPDVLVLSSPSARRRRPYRTIRIPVPVFKRVLLRLSGGHLKWPDDLLHPLSTVEEIATSLRTSTDTVRRRFENAPGVIAIALPRRGKRAHRTLRIPARVRFQVIRATGFDTTEASGHGHESLTFPLDSASPAPLTAAAPLSR